MNQSNENIETIENSKKNSRRHTVTVGIIFSVISVTICLFILLGGINTEKPITDIFTNDNDEDINIYQGMLPVEYKTKDKHCKFKFDASNNIAIEYYDENEEVIKTVKFIFNKNSKISSITQIAENEENLPLEEKLITYLYKTDNVVEENIFENGTLSSNNEYKITSLKDLKESLSVSRYNQDNVLLCSEYYVLDKDSNITEYSYTDAKGETISSYYKGYMYNPQGKIATVYMNSDDSDNIRTVYQYDEKGNLIYTSVLKNEISTLVTTYSYNYDSNGNTLQSSESTNYPLTGKTELINSFYEYNEKGEQIKLIKKNANEDILYSSETVYNPNGTVLQIIQKDFINQIDNTEIYGFFKDDKFKRLNYTLDHWDFETDSPIRYF